MSNGNLREQNIKTHSEKKKTILSGSNDTHVCNKHYDLNKIV